MHGAFRGGRQDVVFPLGYGGLAPCADRLPLLLYAERTLELVCPPATPADGAGCRTTRGGPIQRAAQPDPVRQSCAPATVGGGDRGTRTPNLGIANAALSQLSYIPTRPPAQLYQTAPAHRQFEAPAGSDQPLCRTTSPCVDCRSKAAYGILPWAKGPTKPAKQDSERKEERRTVCNRRYWHRPPISRRRR